MNVKRSALTVRGVTLRQRLRRVAPLAAAAGVVLITRHAYFAQARPWVGLDWWILCITFMGAALLAGPLRLTHGMLTVCYGTAIIYLVILVAATGGAASPFSPLYSLIAVVAAVTLDPPAFDPVVLALSAACLLPFLYTHPLLHAFTIDTMVQAPVLILISSVARTLFKRAQDTADLAEQRAVELAAALDATLLALGSALDLRDTETEGHARRVARNALAIAVRLGLSHDEAETIERGAYLHDIGKIGVPDAVLRKAGPLDQSEWTLMRRHPYLGAQILMRIPFLRPAAALVAAHHERWDGAGYPLGLKGEKIPLGARIFAVADAYDAMTSDRPYRAGLPPADALAEVQRNAGSQFDPVIVSIFVQLVQEGAVLLAASSVTETASAGLEAAFFFRRSELFAGARNQVSALHAG